MKIEFSSNGTAGHVATQAQAAQSEHEAKAETQAERDAVEAAFSAAHGALGAVATDRQATVTIGGEVRGDELLMIYVDVTCLPSAATREAKAAAAKAAAASTAG